MTNKKIPRVSITYSADLTEIPERIEVYLGEVSKKLTSVANFCEVLSKKSTDIEYSKLDFLLEVEAAHEFIQKTAKRVDDCYSIYRGYMEMMVSLTENSQEPSDPPPPQEVKKPKAKKKTSKRKKEK